ncbi:MAG: helix-turn-helix domain-containing protein [Oscillospiraceae bacterium]|nr:helix-turn-helix domain-containing protein [Oscillospiraceae bacterium]
MFNSYPDVLTVDQVREALHIGKNTIYKLLKNNQIKSIRIGTKHVIPKVFLIEYINSCRSHD